LKNTDDLKYSSPLQIIERVLDLTGKDFDLLCCLVERHLGPLYQKDESLAAGISMLLFPSVRPWNVKRALFGDSNDAYLSCPCPCPSFSINSLAQRHHSSDHRNDSGGEANLDEDIEPDAFDVWQKAARSFYHTYLTLFMRIYVNRQKELGSESQRGLGHIEIVREWLHLSLYMSQEKNNNNNNNNNYDDISDRKIKNNDIRYSPGSTLRIEYEKSNRNFISNNKEIEDNQYLYYVKMIIGHPNLYEWDPLMTAALCDAYGCHTEVITVCRQYLTQCSFNNDSTYLPKLYDSEYNLGIKSLLVRCLKFSLSHLVEGLLVNYTSDSKSLEKIRSDDTMARMRESVVQAMKLLWVFLAKDVVWNVRRGGDEEALIDTSVEDLVSTILSSNIYLCSLPFTIDQDEESLAVVNLMNEILRITNDPTMDSMLPLQLIFSHSNNNSSLTETRDTYDSKYHNLLESIRTIVVSEMAQCILSALDFTLTSRVIQVLPENVSNYLDIDFLSQLI
jgi:hypothetical protein